MTRRRWRGRCVHCLRDGVELTKDHVFPSSWYPDTAPKVARWTVPACAPCNSSLGKLEQELLIRLALCMDQSPSTAGLAERGRRALDPACAHSDKDRRGRLAMRRKLHAELNAERELLQLPRDPNATAWKLSELEGIPIRWESMRDVVCKIVRGVQFRETGFYIEPPLKMAVMTGEMTNPSVLRADAVLAEFGQRVAIEPGIVVWRAPGDHPTEALFSVVIWSTWKYFVAVSFSVRDGMFLDNASHLVHPLHW